MTEFLPRSAWTTTDSTSNGRWGTVLGIAPHYPADGDSVQHARLDQAGVRRLLNAYRDYHVSRRGWGDIGYNFAIDQAGRVWELRGLDNVGSHCASTSNPNANTQWVGVLFVVGNREEISAPAVEAFKALRQRVLAKWSGATRIVGHGQIPGASTSCPGAPLRALIANGTLGGVGAPAPSPSPATPPAKTISQMATEVIAGQHGNGHANRQRSLGVSNSVYAQVRAEVNRRAGATTTPVPAPVQKSVAQLAQEVIDGKHGNGDARRRSLGSRYAAVQAEVNRILAGGRPSTPTRSVSQMATEVIRGDHGNGHDARRRSLGVSNSVYAQVRAEVNRRVS